MIGTYRLADINIQIASQFDDVHLLCQDYLSAGVPELTMTVAQEDIDYERDKSAREDKVEGRSVRCWPDSYLETLAVYRRIAESMPNYNTVLFHGSCIDVDGTGYLFTAKSGTGKSTHTRLWRELLGDRAVMVNDDKPLIRVDTDGAVVFGTPWDGKHRLSNNISVPLKALCVLERSPENRIERITNTQAYPMLLQQAYRPKDPAAMAKTLTLLDKLVSVLPLYRLGCNMELDAAKTAYEAMKGV